MQDLKDDNQLAQDARNIDYYQRKAFYISLKYARDLVKAWHHGNELPEAPVIVLGGAGSGKSAVIRGCPLITLARFGPSYYF